MIKKIGVLICVSAALFMGVANAEEVKVSDVINSIITIKGETETADKTVNILILKGGTTFEQAQSQPESLIVYQGEAISEKDKTYSKNIKVDISGLTELDVYVGNSEKYEIALATLSEKRSEAEKITSLDEDKIKQTLSNERSRKILGINSGVMKNVDFDWLKSKVAEAVSVADTFNFNNSDDQKDIEEIERLNQLIEEFAIVYCYNNSKLNVIFNGSEILREDLLKLNVSATILDGYNKILNSDGQGYVRNTVIGKSFADIKALRSEYAKAVMYCGIKNNVTSGGSGHIKSLFTADNVKMSEISLPKYMALSNTAAVNSKLITDTTLTYENFVSKLEEYAGNAGSSTTQGGGSSGGGGGGSSASTKPGTGVNAAQSGISVKPINGNETQEDKTVFADVKADFWAREAIELLQKKGIMVGDEKGNFNPDATLTREQAVTIICQINSFEENYVADMFSDVDQTKWYAKYINIAVSNGIASGVTPTLFGVEMDITRQDFAVMIYRSLVDKEEVDVTLNFADSEDIANYAKEAVSYFVNKGIISGYPDNTFRPNGFITRAEAAAIVYKLIK